MDNYDDDPLTLFRDALSNLLTRDRYEKRLYQFFNFLGLDGDTAELKAKLFTEKAKNNPSWAVSVVMNYLRHHKQRAERGEISTSTLQNYYKPIKLFSEMNDITLNWKRITRSLPKRKAYAIDRIPTLDEIKKLLRYPDRRLRPAVLTMMSFRHPFGLVGVPKMG